MKKTWEGGVDAASDEHCRTKCKTDGTVERQSVVRCLVCLLADNASDHMRLVGVLAAPMSLGAAQAAC